MSLTAIVALLQSALLLIAMAQSTPNLPQSFRDNAITVAQQAIRQANLSLASGTLTPTQTLPSTAVPSQAPVQVPPAQSNPTPTSVSTGPTPKQISIQSNVCNLPSTNLKTEYLLGDLLQNGNIDGRIFMNAYILDQESRNYFSSNPPYSMTITTSDHSNDKVVHGSGTTGPCGYYYSYEFYTIERGTYTITYSIPALNLSKAVTVTVKGPEKPIISSSGITVSTSQQETDYPLSQRGNFSGSNIKYWFQGSKADSYITAQCSDSDTPFTKVDVVSNLGADGLYYPRAQVSSGGIFSGTTMCKFIRGSDNSMTITTESDPVTLTVQ